MKTESHEGWQKWFTSPSSWLALVAAFISVGTFLLVYVHPGQLKIFVSDRIGAVHADGRLELLVPFTVSNTGAPRTQRHVLLASIALHAREPAMQGTDLIWRDEVRLLSKYEYEAKYGKSSMEAAGASKAQKAPATDNPRPFERDDYTGRALPFALWGGNSASKVMIFVEKSPRFGGTRLQEFDITLSLRTESDVFETKSTYRCRDANLVGGFTECRDVSAWQ